MKMIAALTLLAMPLPALAQAQPAPQPAPAAAPDYTQDGDWLCRPGRTDACSANQDATVINADGSRRTEIFTAAADPKFDCFYVYPTVSLDPTPNSDLVIGPEERAVAAFQAARFAKYCRVFAPMYRQVTLTALQALMAGKPANPDRAMAYNDVKAAWDEYLARDNKGRGVVLIGHSQGSGVLKLLLQQEIDGKPVQKQLISAMLLGTNVAVPAGKDVGGDLKSIPLCRKDSQTGCLISYVSFRDNAPPPENSRFGVVPEPGMVAACTNPAALGGGKAVSDAYLGTTGAGLASAKQGPWTSDGAPVTTAFVKVPGLISTQCTTSGTFSYLAVSVNADPADPRTDTIVGDVSVLGKILPDWGLHLIDMPVAMGNLVTIADKQARAWAAKR
ncbi:MAG: lysophospholipase [Sphingomonas sp. 28-66-16]|nr:MAG: lysophospholipase [Sphingomonas sp. 28-66-16]